MSPRKSRDITFFPCAFLASLPCYLGSRGKFTFSRCRNFHSFLSYSYLNYCVLEDTDQEERELNTRHSDDPLIHQQGRCQVSQVKTKGTQSRVTMFSEVNCDYLSLCLGVAPQLFFICQFMAV